MVLATHAIWSAYGFWLPNEQRGSWSTEVWAPHLKRFGPATKTSERRSLANEQFDRELRREMRASLKYPAVRFTLAQVDAIGRGFAGAVERFQISLLACAILWDHVHIVAERHGRATIEYLVGALKRAASRQFIAESLHPMSSYRQTDGSIPTPWVEGGWNRFLNSPREIIDAIDYVNANPQKLGMKPQQWMFVKTYRPRVWPARPRAVFRSRFPRPPVDGRAKPECIPHDADGAAASR